MKQNNRQLILAVGIALFSMFFGAGNLIFPPYMGYAASKSYLYALFGFSTTAIILPVLGVASIALAGHLDVLAGRFSKKFAVIFSVILFIAMGPGLGIPRNEAVSFEMLVTPFMDTVPLWLSVVYSLVFFISATLLAFNPDRLSDLLGKVLGPCLIALIVILFIACMINIPSIPNNIPTMNRSDVFIHGMLDGYLTMDTIASLNFGAIIALSLKENGINEPKDLIQTTIQAGIVAGVLLFIVYFMLTKIGSLGFMFEGVTNGTDILTNTASTYLGTWGSVTLGLVFLLACFTTVTGLLAACGNFFASISKRDYKKIVVVLSVVSFVISISGLDAILKYSVPILLVIYPSCIVLVLLGLFDSFIKGSKNVYRCTICFTLVFSLLGVLHSYNVLPAYLDGLILLCGKDQFAWVVPSVVGLVIGKLMDLK